MALVIWTRVLLLISAGSPALGRQHVSGGTAFEYGNHLDISNVSSRDRVSNAERQLDPIQSGKLQT